MEATAKVKASNGNLVFFLLGLGTLLAMIPYLGPAVILPTLMADLSIPQTALGYIISIFLIVSGVCLFIGSFIQEKIGYTNTYHWGNLLITIGLMITAIAPNFILFMVGRGLSGFGFGLISAAGAPLRAIWFKDKKYAMANSYNTIMSCIGVSLAYILMSALMTATGSWRTVMFIYALASLLYMLICYFFIKYPAGIGEALRQKRDAIKSGKIAREKTSLGRPYKYKDYWLLLLNNLVYTAVNTALLTYMTGYFTKEVGFSASLATLIASLLTLCQVIGAFAGGFLIAQTGRRKTWVVLFSICYSLAAIGLILAGANLALVLILCVIIGVCAFARQPGISMYYVEETDAYDATLVGPAVSMVTGIPLLANIFLSGIIGLMVFSSLGYGKSLIILYAVCFASALPLFALKNIGPRAKKVDLS